MSECCGRPWRRRRPRWCHRPRPLLLPPLGTVTLTGEAIAMGWVVRVAASSIGSDGFKATGAARRAKRSRRA